MKQNVILIQTDCNESSEGRSQSLYNLYTPFFFTKLRLSTVGCPLPINLPKVQRVYHIISYEEDLCYV